MSEPPCRWCKSVNCTPKTSPHCYCLDCEAPLDPCRCRPDCTGGNCYQPCCNRTGKHMTPQEIATTIVAERYIDRHAYSLENYVLEIVQRTLALSRQPKRATIGTHDVTEDLKIMYDAIVGSLDWGSGFLDVEDIAAILRVGTLLGIDTPRADTCPIEMNIPYPEQDPKRRYSYEETQVRHAEYMTSVREAREKWAAQLQAQLDALKEP